MYVLHRKLIQRDAVSFFPLSGKLQWLKCKEMAKIEDVSIIFIAIIPYIFTCNL